MTTNTTVKAKTTANRVTSRFTLKNLPTFDVAGASKPLYAVVGVADLAIEQAKDVPADLTAQVAKVQARLADVPAQVKTLPAQVKTLPAQVKTLRAQVKTLRSDVESRVEKANKKVTDLYTELTSRGKKLVTQIRRQPATQASITEGKEAVKKAEAAATAVKKAVKAGEKAVAGAAGKIG